MTGSRISPIDGCRPNSRRAIGTPDAIVFLEAQNTAAISSSIEKPRRRTTRVVSQRTSARINAAPSSAVSSTPGPLSRHKPEAVESQKAVRVRNRMSNSFDEHQAIVDAIGKGDSDLAAALLRSHVMVQGERFTDLVATMKDLAAAKTE